MQRILDHVGRRSGIDPRGTKSQLTRRAERQTILVSATVPFLVIRVARSWGHDPLPPLLQAKKVVPLKSVPPSRPVSPSGPTSRSGTNLNLQSQVEIQSDSTVPD